MTGPILALLGAALCVAANAFFVAAEFALAKVRPSALQALAQRGDKPAARALALTNQLDAVLSATQLGITLASLGLGWLGEEAFAAILLPVLSVIGFPVAAVHGMALAVAFGTISLLHIVIGELVPKSLALQRTESVARLTARPLRLFYWATYPALWILNSLSRRFLHWMGLGDVIGDGILTSDEMRLLFRSSARAGVLEERTRDLLDRVLRGSERIVRAIMVPRVDMVAVSIEDSVEDVLAVVRKHGYSRYPLVEEGNPDKVIGYVYVKDLLMAPTPAGGLRALKRDTLFVPETRQVGDVLTAFQRTNIPIAIVVDEYGGTSGLITVEDIVEELVGDIQDEHDLEPPKVRVRADGVVLVDGLLPVGELQIEGLEMPELESADTLSGYLVAALGRLAHPGDRVRLGRYDAVVEDVRRRRISRVALVPRPVSEPPPESSPPPEVGSDI